MRARLKTMCVRSKQVAWTCKYNARGFFTVFPTDFVIASPYKAAVKNTHACARALSPLRWVMRTSERAKKQPACRKAAVTVVAPTCEIRTARRRPASCALRRHVNCATMQEERNQVANTSAHFSAEHSIFRTPAI